jgi:CRP/FNR family transcriptional regulator
MRNANARKTVIGNDPRHQGVKTGADHDDMCSDIDSIREKNSNKLKHFSANEIIYREVDPVSRVYIIRNGIVKLVSYLPNGRARIIRLHSRNDWLGLEGLIDLPYEHTAIAVGDVEVYYVPIDSLRKLENCAPRQYSQLLKHAYEHLVQADKWIADFSTGGIKPRVARLLLYLSDFEYGESSNMIDLLTVHELADMLGVTQESVSRILADLKRKDTLHKTAESNDETYEIDQKGLHYEAGR